MRGKFPYEILLVGLLVFSLGWFHIGRESYWNDEFLALQFSVGRFAHETMPKDTLIHHPPLITHPDGTSIWAMWDAERYDTHPTLYFSLLRFWRFLFGSSETATRSLSCITMTGGVMLLMATVRELEGRIASIFSGLAMAVASTTIQYAQETRNYGVLMLLSMATAWVMALISRRGATASRLILLGIGMFLMQLTHNFALGAIAGMCIFAFVALPRRDAMRVWIAAGCAMLLFAITWGPILVAQIRMNKTTSSYLYSDVDDHAWQTIIRLVRDPARLLVGKGTTMFLPDQVPIWSIGMALAIIAWALANARRRRSLQFWSIWLVCVIGLITTSDVLRRTWLLNFVRYMILALPAMCGMIGSLSVGRWPNRLLAGCCVLAIATQITNGYTRKPMWRDAINAINTQGRPNEPIIFAVAKAITWSPQSLYMSLSTYLPDDNQHSVVLQTHPPDEALLNEMKPYRNVWVVTDRYTPTPSHWLRGATELQQVDISGIEVMFHVRLAEGDVKLLQ